MSKIEWTEMTWNPVVGCTRASAGCDGCSTGDCPHESVHECVQAQARIIAATEARVRELETVLRTLAQAEHEYRRAHDLHGDGHPESGRAWDRLRHAGDSTRAALNPDAKGGE